MREPVISKPGEAIVADGATFAMRIWSHGPNAGPPLHVHHHDDEAWHIIEGTLRFALGDRTVDASPGSTVFVPAGVAHTFGNPGPGDARYLVVMGERILRLIDALHNLAPASDAEVAAMYRQYDAEIVR